MTTTRDADVRSPFPRLMCVAHSRRDGPCHFFAMANGYCFSHGGNDTPRKTAAAPKRFTRAAMLQRWLLRGSALRMRVQADWLLGELGLARRRRRPVRTPKPRKRGRLELVDEPDAAWV